MFFNDCREICHLLLKLSHNHIFVVEYKKTVVYKGDEK